MSLADDANLLLIPTGYKAEKLYSIFPTSGVGDFDFARTTSATRVAKNGFITTVGTNVPRLNYDILDGEVVGCPHLLLEPERTNLEAKSNEFSTWGTVSNTTRTANYIISPDGTLNATRLQFTANGYVANTSQSLATYTVSCYAKRNDNGTQNVGFFTNGSGVVNSAWDITSEWKRFSYTFPALNASFMGIAGVSGADISVYGFQIEGLVSYATSYIPTNGEVGGVTRAAETCNGAGNAATFNDSEGVLMFEISALVNDNNFKSISVSESNADNRITLSLYQGSLFAYIADGGVGQFNVSQSVGSVLEFHKTAIKYKANDCAFWIDGFEVAINTSPTTMPSGLKELAFDQGDGGDKFYGKTKQIQYHSTVLSDSNLEKLTSWTSFEDMAQSQLYTIQ
jgi:hypothetical protein